MTALTGPNAVISRQRSLPIAGKLSANSFSGNDRAKHDYKGLKTYNLKNNIFNREIALPLSAPATLTWWDLRISSTKYVVDVCTSSVCYMYIL